jgi:GH24 family phage-related lysozyme (muramidase)
MLHKAVLLSAMLAVAFGCQTALQLIEQAEGFRACTYVDTTGHRTICYGFNLEVGSARSRVEGVGGNWNDVYNNNGCLSNSQCVQLLSAEVTIATGNAQRIFGTQCPCIQAVLIDMTYNMGLSGMSSFTTFNSLITSHNWAAAASDIRGTLWCRQTGTRCTRNAGIIANGC